MVLRVEEEPSLLPVLLLSIEDQECPVFICIVSLSIRTERDQLESRHDIRNLVHIHGNDIIIVGLGRLSRLLWRLFLRRRLRGRLFLPRSLPCDLRCRGIVRDIVRRHQVGADKTVLLLVVVSERHLIPLLAVCAVCLADYRQYHSPVHLGSRCRTRGGAHPDIRVVAYDADLPRIHRVRRGGRRIRRLLRRGRAALCRRYIRSVRHFDQIASDVALLIGIHIHLIPCIVVRPGGLADDIDLLSRWHACKFLTVRVCRRPDHRALRDHCTLYVGKTDHTDTQHHAEEHQCQYVLYPVSFVLFHNYTPVTPRQSLFRYHGAYIYCQSQPTLLQRMRSPWLP